MAQVSRLRFKPKTCLPTLRKVVLSSFSALNSPQSTPTTLHRPEVLRFEPRFAQSVAVETGFACRLRRRCATGCTALSNTYVLLRLQVVQWNRVRCPWGMNLGD